MRLLIAGAHGQIARCLMEQAIGRPTVTTCALGRAASDLCTPGAVLSAMTGKAPDVVINTAAFTAVDAAERDPQNARRLNREGAARLAAEAAQRGAVIIHLSTNYVFDGKKLAPYVPGDATAPLNVYGRTKLEGEIAVAAANPRHVIARTSWIHSPHGENFVKAILKSAADSDSIEVVDDHIGTPTYAPHLAEALLDLAEQLAGCGVGDPRLGVHHLAGTGAASWADLAREVFEVSARLGGPAAHVEPVKTRPQPGKAERPANACLDGRSAAEKFDVRIPDWRDGVAQGVRVILS